MDLVPIEQVDLHELERFLAVLGDGESGFGGTGVHSGNMSVQDYVSRCTRESDPKTVPESLVPQTTLIITDSDGRIAGMVRLRHHLNAKLLNHGGHIGFYVLPSRRGRGIAKWALARALAMLPALGEHRALLTADASNVPSINVIEANGGTREDTRLDSETGGEYHRYWVPVHP